VCAAHFLEGLSDAAVEALLTSARTEDYSALSSEARRLHEMLRRQGRRRGEVRVKSTAALLRLRKRLAEATAIDFFNAPGRDAVEGLLRAAEALLHPPAGEKDVQTTATLEARGRTWVTRAGVQVDRIASAWLIRRFIDPEARFKLVPGHGYAPEPGEL